MKKLLLLLSLTAIIQVVCSQEIVLTFQPADGVSVVDSIKSTNPATSEVSVIEGTVVTLPDATTSVSILQNELSKGRVYPNPFNGQTEIQFATSSEEVIVVSVANAAGQVVLRQQKQLQQGSHRFQLSVKSQGMYFITLAGKENTTSIKAVSLYSGGKEDRLTWLGSSPVEGTEKSVKAEEGKLYHFEIHSGENVTMIADSPTESKTYQVEFHECKDADGRNYKIVQFGEQWWMAENLAYLPQVNIEPSTTVPKFYVSGYDSTDTFEAKQQSNYSKYGVLYNWPAVMQGANSSTLIPSGVQGICPANWHVPSDDEWGKLASFLDDENGPYELYRDDYYNMGRHLKSRSGWNSDGNGSDDYGFSGLPGGYGEGNGVFSAIGSAGIWWSSTEYTMYGNNAAWYRTLNSGAQTFYRDATSVMGGFSVRCVKDPAPVEYYKMEVDVIDLDTWSLDNPFPDKATNANVKILSKQNPDKSNPVYEGTSDSNGKVIFPEILAGDYYIYVEKEAQTNLIEKETVDGQEVGYVVNGIFATEYDIAKSISLPGTMVGDPIIVDVNEDGILNKNDKAVGYEISVTGFTRPMVYIFTEK